MFAIPGKPTGQSRRLIYHYAKISPGLPDGIKAGGLFATNRALIPDTITATDSEKIRKSSYADGWVSANFHINHNTIPVLLQRRRVWLVGPPEVSLDYRLVIPRTINATSSDQ